MKLKRHGDAHLGLNAKPEFAHLVRDDLLGLLCYTDAVLLWLYSYWADEQSLGRVRGSPYSQSQALRDFVRASWERYGREQAKSDREKEMVKGMIGLMCVSRLDSSHCANARADKTGISLKRSSSITSPRRPSPLWAVGPITSSRRALPIASHPA